MTLLLAIADLFAHHDYTAPISSILHIDEDSPIIDLIFRSFNR